jgi:YidC/Oxa1 family membrane protein insertase
VLNFLDPAIHAAYLAVSALATALHPISGDASTALAIVIFTIAVKLCLSPLAVSAARAERARAALTPRLTDLRARYRKDPTRLAAETKKLHDSHGISPLAGCLPALLQMPVLSVVYRLFVLDTVAGQPNTLLVATLFGAPLGSPWPSVVATFGLLSWPSLAAAALVALLIAVAAAASRQLRARVTVAGAAGRLTRLMPFATVVFAAFVPMATAVYLLTSSAWTVAERASITHLLG